MRMQEQSRMQYAHTECILSKDAEADATDADAGAEADAKQAHG